MSDILTLAEALNAHAAATRELAQAIVNQGATTPSSPRSEVQAADPQSEKPKRGRPAKAQSDTSETTDQAGDTPSEPQTSTPPAEPEVTYDNVKALILKVSSEKGRAAAAGVLEAMGVEKGPDLKPDQYAETVERLQAVLSEGDLA